MWLPDVIDERGLRTTIRVEPAVAHYARTAQRWTTPPLLLAWSDTLRRKLLRGVQHGVMDGRWAVDVESDDGVTLRREVAGKAAALALGQEIHDALTRDGLAALEAFR